MECHTEKLITVEVVQASKELVADSVWVLLKNPV